MRLNRAEEIAVGGGADAADVAASQAARISSRMRSCLLAALPLGVGPQQVLLGHHLEDGPDVLRHAAVDEDEALLQLLARLRRCVLAIEDAVVGAAGGRG